VPSPLFQLSSRALAAGPPFPVDAGSGALVSFDGIVRALNRGRSVYQLEYSAYTALAEREGERIVTEAIARYGLSHAYCIHRVGKLSVGDVAVRVWVAAAHRQAAFAACAYIIEQVKMNVPIWKHETYRDGSRSWIGCEDGDAVTPTGRHLVLAGTR